MQWIKAFHIIFVVTWFAGLFYLPRLFVYHVDAKDSLSYERFLVMERRLMMITHIGAILTIVFGLTYLGKLARLDPTYMQQGWLHAKLFMVALLIGYHGSLQIFIKRFREQRNTQSARFFRLYNEVPALLLIGIVIMVVVKPF
jgi:protoporphyrinogen IX oxidase